MRPLANAAASAVLNYICHMPSRLDRVRAPLLHAMRRLTVAALSMAVTSTCAGASSVAADVAMVSTAQHLATQAGVDVLKAGGNAVDAAVAVGYVLAVVYPAAGNLGGGGFMTLRLADGHRVFIDFREKAPLAAKRDMYLDPSGKSIEKASLLGHLAVAVPGTVAGLEYARVKYGTMRREPLIAPAVALAQEGFVLESADVRAFGGAVTDLRRDKASAAIFLENGEARRAGSRLVQKDLAATLREIVRLGADGFYRGRVAEAIVAANRAGGGILSMEDFARYAPRELPPLECEYRGYHIISAPPPSSGGVIVCEILHVLEGYPMKEWGAGSARAIHHHVEAMRHAYLDRNGRLGDPDFVKNPVELLLDTAYAGQIRAAIDPAKAAASASLRLGKPPHEGTNTTHYSIIDAEGNAVAVTYTLNESFGARVTAGGTGVLLNNEMDDFTVKLGEGNLFGLVQGEQNLIEPGKRPLSSMSPTIVVREGKPVMVLGTQGGSRIISAVVHTLVNVIDYGMDIQQAVETPRFHQQWMPEETLVERGAIAADTRRVLESEGHRFRDGRDQNHMCAILVRDGHPYGASPPRGCSAQGY
jgi:gamma-glutamyltranspeptidase/glutathione hydrolase